jgi:IS605 OrfB family transposase
MRTLEYRLYPNAQQRRQLMACLIASRGLYNEMLETTKAAHAQTGKFLFKSNLTAQFKGREGDTVPATTVQMLADRLDKALRRYLACKEQGFPCKAARKAAKTHLKIKRQRRDFLFKTTKPYAESYQRIWVENLNISGMLQNHALAKSIADASWGMFIEILAVKVERAGHQVIHVPARFTSQKCHQCGELVQKSLSVRTHICPFCGNVEDRDVNAAKNIFAAGTPPSGANVHH